MRPDDPTLGAAAFLFEDVVRHAVRIVPNHEQVRAELENRQLAPRAEAGAG